MAQGNGLRGRLPCGKALRLILFLSLLSWAAVIPAATGVWVLCEHLLFGGQPAAPITGVDLPTAAPNGPSR